MAALPASRAVVLPDISAGDGHANSVQTPPSRRSSSSVATPTTSPALAVTRQLASPEATASLSGEPSSTPHSMGRSTVITTAARIASPATFLNSDARLYPRDGRVRDPVPSKLKGVSGDLSGNFSVMHMDVNSHPKSKGRDAAAKRTSEGTALQAKLASTSSYVSHHRRANYPKPTGLKQYASSTPSQVQQLPAAAAHPIIPAPTAWLPSSDQELIMLPLTPREVKSEQARLLTLLRTLPPATVVDQLSVKQMVRDHFL
ncbi:uncharacterized protein B0I36DRAFT_386637 [Microdochium trichocladiopsis]|uniref:Uncharacterized protein n=1 Tax=Microdochium trichocladiopsis TaxID=1682393 RepID=A0A9P8Y050_9PEZI|nr:uncharacterized protein B0I36DRAFT_386637 [Microdochium trichocladiopsis]KAH7026359.1 hypothetical protein B0I36DRAFT_386637 [Microdochium trichocladiopsis]